MPSRSYLAQWLNRRRPNGKWPDIAEMEIVINSPMRTGKRLKGPFEYFRELRDDSEDKETCVSNSDAQEDPPQLERMPRHCTEWMRVDGQNYRAEREDTRNGVLVRRLPPAHFLAANFPRSPRSPSKGRIRSAELCILFWQAIHRKGWVCTKQIVGKVVELLHGMGKLVPDMLEAKFGEFLAMTPDFFFQIEDNDGILWVTSDTST